MSEGRPRRSTPVSGRRSRWAMHVNLTCVLLVKYFVTCRAPSNAPRVHPCARLCVAWSGMAWASHPWTGNVERGGARARTGFARLAAGRAVCGDRGLLSAADAQRRRGTAQGRGRRGADGLRDGRDGRAPGRVHPTGVGLARVYGGVRRGGTADPVGPAGGPYEPSPPA